MNPIDRALELAFELEGRPGATARPAGPITRRFALGDPQSSAERLFRVLDANGLLGDDGRLAHGAGLLVVGDYFDYRDPRGRDQAGREGLAFLSWLAHHPPEQVQLLAGNHDLCRVMELAFETDDSFGQARALGEQIHAKEQQADEPAHALRERFHREHPRIPTPEVARRDFAAFSEAQRTMVQRLLVAERMRLAAPARLASGERVLAVHAGVTSRELELLGIEAVRDVDAIAARLNRLLEDAVSRVQSEWAAGRKAALDLSPVHVAGCSGIEGGGLLYHRPAKPDRSGGDWDWEFRPDAPRRFDPRTLPLGLVQLAGHTGHRKCVEELGEWVTSDAGRAASCSVRTLTTDGSRVVYDCGVRIGGAGEATLLLVDAQIDRADPAEVRLLRLG